MAAPKLKPAAISLERSLFGLRGLVQPFWLVALLWCGVLALLSVARYAGYNSAMLDLGNMAQAIASVGRGEPLVFTFKEGATSRLALHVELIYFLFAPVYALWPDPRVLLVGQAALFALGALPVYRLALRRTESVFAARCATLLYLFYPVAQTSVLFDFHGDTLAMPILLFALDALDQRAWGRYAVALALALSCKFYVAAPVALLGCLMWWQGLRRAGLATMLAGLAYGVVAFAVVRPLFTTAQTSAAHRGLNYLSFYFGQLSELLNSWDQRLISAIIVFGPLALLIRLGWRWLIPALPIAAAALLSTGPGGAYDYRYHHYAIVVPFLIMAAIDGLAQLKRRGELRRVALNSPTQHQSLSPRARGRRSWRGDLVLTLLVVLIFNAALVDAPLNPLFWLAPPGQGLSSSAFGSTERDRMKDRWLTLHVPPKAPLAVSNFLAPHLVNRETLYLVRYPDEPTAQRLPSLLDRVQYAFADALFDFATPLDDGGIAGGVAYDHDAIRQLMQAPGWGLTAARDGLLRFERAPASGAVLQQRIMPVAAGGPALARFGGAVELVMSAIEPLGGRRYRATFRWRALRDFQPNELLVAVSRLEGLPHARMVHLPSYALRPTSTWSAGAVWEEEFEIELPADVPAGQYRWLVGWYDTRHIAAAETDERSRVGVEANVMVLELR